MAGKAAAMLRKKKKTIDLGDKGTIKIKPGALHSQLGVPQGQKIPAGMLAKAAQAGGKLGQRARLAEAMKTWKH